MRNYLAVLKLEISTFRKAKKHNARVTRVGLGVPALVGEEHATRAV